MFRASGPKSSELDHSIWTFGVRGTGSTESCSQPWLQQKNKKSDDVPSKKLNSDGKGASVIPPVRKAKETREKEGKKKSQKLRSVG